ncbi:uncharacterized protein G2W53_034963 [Senna tora]|uniref:Uncharacterized protein n=1 Tax=Senna tora TaxID=362788 RepID=A0A834W3P0_9FABA|nr:uncharacterized protein G2W53_034963 [Senna tora]
MTLWARRRNKISFTGVSRNSKERRIQTKWRVSSLTISKENKSTTQCERRKTPSAVIHHHLTLLPFALRTQVAAMVKRKRRKMALPPRSEKGGRFNSKATSSTSEISLFSRPRAEESLTKRETAKFCFSQ